jgi:hypothetical protein
MEKGLYSRSLKYQMERRWMHEWFQVTMSTKVPKKLGLHEHWLKLNGWKNHQTDLKYFLEQEHLPWMCTSGPLSKKPAAALNKTCVQTAKGLVIEIIFIWSGTSWISFSDEVSLVEHHEKFLKYRALNQTHIEKQENKKHPLVARNITTANNTESCT